MMMKRRVKKDKKRERKRISIPIFSPLPYP
jgi:hypothetical protein